MTDFSNKRYKFIDIKNKEIEVINKNNNPEYTIQGRCTSNPNPPISRPFPLYVSVMYLGVFVQDKNLCINIDNNYHKYKNLYMCPFLGEIIYIPIPQIKEINVIEKDKLPIFLLFWIGKYKNIPDDIIYVIYKYINGWKIKSPVYFDNNQRNMLINN